MVKKRRTNDDRQAPLFWGLTPNQLVGHNLWRARQERGWTQAQAAEALEPHLGIRWTVAQVSAAERSIDGNRIRQFTADDLVAFAQAFRLPVTYFFLPTRPAAKWSKVDPKASTDQLNRTAAAMLDIIFGDAADGAPRLTTRLREVMEYLDPALMTRAQRQVHDLAKRRLLAIVEKAIGSLGTWQHTLRAMADDLAVLAAETAESLSNSFPDVYAEDVAALMTARGEEGSDKHARSRSPVAGEVVE
jgi:transcriptional regulator with XRE-family HTH domain